MPDYNFNPYLPQETFPTAESAQEMCDMLTRLYRTYNRVPWQIVRWNPDTGRLKLGRLRPDEPEQPLEEFMCHACGEIKPRDEFPVDARAKTFRSFTCTDCHNKRREERIDKKIADGQWDLKARMAHNYAERYRRKRAERRSQVIESTLEELAKAGEPPRHYGTAFDSEQETV